MDLLPGHFADFGKKEYWDRFFASRQKEEDSAFEWYGTYEVSAIKFTPTGSDFFI